MTYRNPIPTVDTIIVFPSNEIVIVKRKFEPYKDRWCLPGGHVDYGETVEQAAIRESKEETGLDVKLTKLLGVYSDPKRDPSKHSISTVFVAKPIGGELKAGDDAIDAMKTSNPLSHNLAFDHEKMMEDFFMEHKT